jgi:hypothetical protein
MAERRSLRRAARSPWLLGLARAGFVARATVYAIVAVLALEIAFGTPRHTADKQGALATIAEQPLGRVLLVALGAGFGAYALWRVGHVLFPRRVDREQPTRRLAHLGTGLLYVAFSLAAFRMVLFDADDGDRGREADVSASVLALPFGRVLVGLGGLAMLAACAWSVRRIVTKSFRRDLDAAKMTRAARASAEAAAAGGFAARGAVQLLIGVFLLRTAWKHDPSETVGFDGALRVVASTTFGGALLVLFAAGFLARAVFSIFEARFRRIE